MKKLYNAPVVDLQEYDNYEVITASYQYFDPDWAVDQTEPADFAE